MVCLRPMKLEAVPSLYGAFDVKLYFQALHLCRAHFSRVVVRSCPEAGSDHAHPSGGICSSLNLIGQLASGDRSGSSVGWRSGGDHLLLCERDGVKEGLHRGLAEAPPTLMRPVFVVAPDPLIKVGLQLGD